MKWFWCCLSLVFVARQRQRIAVEFDIEQVWPRYRELYRRAKGKREGQASAATRIFGALWVGSCDTGAETTAGAGAGHGRAECRRTGCGSCSAELRLSAAQRAPLWRSRGRCHRRWGRHPRRVARCQAAGRRHGNLSRRCHLPDQQPRSRLAGPTSGTTIGRVDPVSALPDAAVFPERLQRGVRLPGLDAQELPDRRWRLHPAGWLQQRAAFGGQDYRPAAHVIRRDSVRRHKRRIRLRQRHVSQCAAEGRLWRWRGGGSGRQRRRGILHYAGVSRRFIRGRRHPYLQQRRCRRQGRWFQRTVDQCIGGRAESGRRCAGCRRVHGAVVLVRQHHHQ